MNILVADDSITVRRIMEFTFAGEDAKVTSVESGDAAIAKAPSLTPDIVFADLSMSTDGYQVANAIRAAPGLERTAVILLASQKHPYDEAKGKAAGVDDHVIKPFDTQHVIDKVKRVMSQPRALAPAKAPAAQPVAAPPQAAAVPAAVAASRPSRTIAFERGPVPQAAQPPAQAPQARPPSQVASPPAATASAARGAAVATANSGELAAKLDGLGLTAAQVEGVLKLSREVIEKVVWEVVPDLAETIIREEIKRLTS